MPLAACILPLAAACLLPLAACLLPLAPALAAQQPRSQFRALAIEAAGAIAGSAIGYGAVVLTTHECTRDDDVVSCIVGPVGGALIASTAGAALGDIVAGKSARTNPSIVGASIGAILGSVAAVAADHLIREEFRMRTGRAGTWITVAVTQGVVTAIASRAVAAIRDRR